MACCAWSSWFVSDKDLNQGNTRATAQRKARN
jgi:hypothetical protein